MKLCADLSRKSKSVKAIYIYASERSCYGLLENTIVYCAMNYFFGDISVIEILLKSKNFVFQQTAQNCK